MKNLILLLVGILFIPNSIFSQSKPNVLFIIADDMGYSDLSCFGSEIQTPSLDSLANRGIRFRQFYNSAKCEPTRTSLMSGQYWHDAGMKINKGPTLGNIMQSVGYRTMAVGKWHLKGNPIDKGFNRFFGHLGGVAQFFDGGDDLYLDKKKYTAPANYYATRAYGDFAIDFIDECRNDHPGKPFFMYLAHSAPHAPLEALPEDIALFENTYSVGWDTIKRRRIQRQLAMGIIDSSWSIPQRPRNIPSWNEITSAEKTNEAERMAIYAAMIYRMDKSIGRVIDHLDDLGIRNNTLIVFMSDNGASYQDWGRLGVNPSLNNNHGLGWAYASNTPFRLYKRNQHQGGACTGAVFAWDSVIVNKGSITDKQGHIVDILKTLTEISGASYPAKWDGKNLATPPGKSLVPILKNESFTPRNYTYFHLFDHAAVISSNWKIVKSFGDPWELYNLNSDRCETNNLKDSNPEKYSELLGKWQTWADNKNIKFNDKGDEPIYIRLDGTKYEPGTAKIANTAEFLKFYPNPAKDKLFIELPNSNYSSLEIFSKNSKLVFQKSFQSNRIQIDLVNFQQGCYVLRFFDGETYLTKKLVLL